MGSGTCLSVQLQSATPWKLRNLPKNPIITERALSHLADAGTINLGYLPWPRDFGRSVPHTPNSKSLNLGVRIRGTLGDIDPLNKVPFKRARSRVQKGSPLMGLPSTT